MTLSWSYLAGTASFVALLAVCVTAQISAWRFHAMLYWLFGTSTAGFFHRSLGIGYTRGSLMIFTLLMASLAFWRWKMGSIALETVHNPRTEACYRVTNTPSQTLRGAFGDWTSNVAGLGFRGGAAFFVSALAVLALLYNTTNASHVFLFWAVVILRR